MPGRRLAAGASFGLRIVFVDSAKYVFPPSGRPGTPCVMLRSAVNYEDNFESCVCVLHITSFRLREFLPCKPICFKPTTRPPLPPPPLPPPPPPSSSAASMCQLSAHLPVSTIVIRQTDLNENLRSDVREKLSIHDRPGSTGTTGIHRGEVETDITTRRIYNSHLLSELTSV